MPSVKSSLSVDIAIGCEDCYDLENDKSPWLMTCLEVVDGVSTYMCYRCKRKVSIGIEINGEAFIT